MNQGPAPKRTTRNTRRGGRAAAGGTRALREEGLSFLERSFDPSGSPVIGLFLYSACMKLLRSLREREQYRVIVPGNIGTPAILQARPGISQIELAAYLGVERATAGKYVANCMKRGLVRRVVSTHDRRRFSLFVTPKGVELVKRVSAAIPRHEDEFTSALTPAERETLRTLLRKLLID